MGRETAIQKRSWARTAGCACWTGKIFLLLRRPRQICQFTRSRPGYLPLIGRETLRSLYQQSLVARRQQSHCFSASTVIEFEPEHFQQLAVLICYYNSTKFHYIYLSHDETVGKHLRVMTCAPDAMQADSFTPPVAICASKSTTTGSGCSKYSTPAFSPKNASPPARPTSLSPSSALPAETCLAGYDPPTLTSSTTGKGVFANLSGHFRG